MKNVGDEYWRRNTGEQVFDFGGRFGHFCHQYHICDISDEKNCPATT